MYTLTMQDNTINVKSLKVFKKYSLNIILTDNCVYFISIRRYESLLFYLIMQNHPRKGQIILFYFF